MKQPIDRKLEHELKMMRKAFKRKFGRDPGPDDPVFFDPEAETPVPISQERMQADMLAAMKAAGLAPEPIYAYRKTGLLLMEEHQDDYPPGAVEDWQAAIDEYYALEKKQKPDK